MPSLDDKTALVTGAGSGIGRGIAEALAEEGATVAINHLPSEQDAEQATEAVQSIEDQGGEALALAGDVTDAASVRSMLDEFEETVGSPDILVNNAGILTQSRMEEMSIETWDETLSTDLRGTFLATRFTLPKMLEQKSGKIINIASQLGIKGSEELVHYCAAKAGVIGLTRALAREVSPEVNVNAIAPGTIETSLIDGLNEEWKEQQSAKIPMERFGTISDVVPTAVFLAGPGGDYYTGQTLSPDGGDAMH